MTAPIEYTNPHTIEDDPTWFWSRGKHRGRVSQVREDFWLAEIFADGMSVTSDAEQHRAREEESVCTRNLAVLYVIEDWEDAQGSEPPAVSQIHLTRIFTPHTGSEEFSADLLPPLPDGWAWQADLGSSVPEGLNWHRTKLPTRNRLNTSQGEAGSPVQDETG